MDIKIERTEGQLLAILSGEWDIAATPEAEKALEPLYDCMGCDIVFEIA